MNPFEIFDKYERETAAIRKNLARLKTPAFEVRILNLWDKGGLLSIDWNAGRMWLNVVTHMTVSAILADRLATKLREEGHIGMTITKLVQAALIHDWQKRIEEEARENARYMNEQDPTIVADNISKECSVTASLIIGGTVADLTLMMGHEGILRASQRKLTWEEKILLYVDCCVSDNKITTYQKRADNLASHYRPGGRYKEADIWFKENFGTTRQETYDKIVLPIQQEFADILKIFPDQVPIAFSPPDLCEI